MRNEAIDCHAHICPDHLAARNREIIERSSGITPAYDGSVRQLKIMMEKAHIGMCIVNNIVLRPELMQKANDFTAQVVSNGNGKFWGMGWIVPGDMNSVQEIERCKFELGFIALKVHNSHFKVFPSDPKNDKIYEKIVELKLPVLFHCGTNPYSGSDVAQYSMPKNFVPVLKSFPEMKVILGHAAGFQDNPEQALELLSVSNYAVADTSVDIRGKRVDFRLLLEKAGDSKIVFGSDYPIHEGAHILGQLADVLAPDELGLVTSKNLRRFLSM